VYREIEGDGVIGFQPVIEPSQIHEYNSACHLETDIGKMNGFYTFQKLENGESFHVNIPEFKLICPYRSN
jgi:ApaG protein